MYSAYWCPHCHEQKELFGQDAAAKLDVIECATDGKNSQATLCQSKAIEGLPQLGDQRPDRFRCEVATEAG